MPEQRSFLVLTSSMPWCPPASARRASRSAHHQRGWESSVILFYWVNHPEKKWLAWLLGTIFVLVIVFSILGFVLA